MTTRRSDVGVLLQAAHFAADKHRDQRRKGVRNTPYINHPLEVAEILNRVGGIEDAEVLAAAVLHDTIEDTVTSAKELERRFGKRVAALVEELTDEAGLTWQQRKRHEIDHARHLSPDAKRIKIADKMCNVSDTISNPPGEWTLQRRRDYLEFAELVADGCRGIDARLDAEFDRVLAEARQRLG